MLEHITIEPKKNADACVIWLHGLGADGHDFEGIIPQLGLPNDHSIRFVFPHAPIRPVTINMHMEMRAWYDIFALNSLEQQDSKGILESCALIEDLIQQQNISKERIILAGFSQGGAIALHMSTTTQQSYAGILALSTYLPFLHSPEKLSTITQPEQAMLLCHGSYDDIVPSRAGKESYDYLKQTCNNIKWKEYAMGHQVCPQEIQDIGEWLRERLL